MCKQFILAGLALVLGTSVLAQPAKATSATPSTSEARAKFIKKCFRDRTPQSCNAPPEARLPAKA